MKKKILIILVCLINLFVISGCSSNNEITALKEENQKLKDKLAQYEKPASNVTQDKQAYDVPPIQIQEISFDKSGVTGVKIVVQNTSDKTIDAVELALITFDNFGRPAKRFGNEDNVVDDILMQKVINKGGSGGSSWTIFNYDDATKGKVVVKQIHYTDGTVWTNTTYQKQITNEKKKLE